MANGNEHNFAGSTISQINYYFLRPFTAIQGRNALQLAVSNRWTRFSPNKNGTLFARRIPIPTALATQTFDHTYPLSLSNEFNYGANLPRLRTNYVYTIERDSRAADSRNRVAVERMEESIRPAVTMSRERTLCCGNETDARPVSVWVNGNEKGEGGTQQPKIGRK